MKRKLLSLGALLGLGGILAPSGITPSIGTAVAPAAQNLRAATSQGQQTQRQAPTPTPARSNALANFLIGGGGRHLRGSGMTPYEWGISRACDRMRRKNRMRAAGVGGQRI